MSPRAWDPEKHLSDLEPAPWGPMYDSDGNEINGITGKKGVRGQKADGTFIGCDYIRMEPGTAFPLHVHDGDHEIYFIGGCGYVHIDGQAVNVHAGNTIHIPAEYPHAVWVPENASGPLVFVAIGHPHNEVDSVTRSRSVPDTRPQREDGHES